MGEQPKSKKTMLCRSSGKLYVYNAELAGDEYLGDSITEINGTLKFMCLETTTVEEPKRKNCKPKEVKSLSYYLEVTDNPELKKFVENSEIGKFGFVFEQDEYVWQIFLCSPKNDSLIFDVEKYRTRYAISKVMSIEQAIKGLKEDLLYISEN